MSRIECFIIGAVRLAVGKIVSNCFKVYGPFEIANKLKVYDKDWQKTFWNEGVDDETDNYQLSLARGIYLFSLRNAANYTPQYVGMTGRDFRTEVFNDRNLLTIITTIARERGVLCLHLLARPKETQRGFSKDVGEKMCRMKNPDLCNVAKSTFLLKTSIEGLTDGTSHRGERIQSFRNALGIDDLNGQPSRPRRQGPTPNQVIATLGGDDKAGPRNEIA
jgi:hypothetical protein